MRISVIWLIALGFLVGGWLLRLTGESQGDVAPVHRGTTALRGGKPTVRRPFIRPNDDPTTTNDESNDQPVGHFGTETVSVCSLQAGNCYTLDADVSGDSLDRIYFPRGGWVDFPDCDLEDLKGECDDEQGRTWEFRGAL